MRSERAAMLAVIVLIAGCEIEKVSIPRTDARVALHGVLSATAPSQVVLLERTRSGVVQLTAPPFDLPDPVVSDSGVGEPDAVVTLTTPDGQTLNAVEDSKVRNDGRGTGNYRFALAGTSLSRAGTYRLTVHTARGELLTAETSVPGGLAAAVAEDVTFDRSRDTIVLEWPASPGAKSYYVRVESPFGPHAFFTDSTRVRLPGDLRNTDLDRLPHVFIPGFPQAVTVSAVDSNYYDWYRSHNDVLSGIGLVNRVQGGLGVFGSLVRLRYQNLSVVTQQTEAIAGHYVFVGTNEERLGIPFLSLEVYTESRAAHAGQQDDLSGRYEKRLILGETDPIRGLLGKVGGGRIQLAFLSLWSAYDTLDVLTGEVHGDTIVGTFRSHAGTGHFVKN